MMDMRTDIEPITVVSGEIFTDCRGTIHSMNSFSFEGVERYYFIRNIDTRMVRGWHGHQFERKWFQCVAGSFTMAFVAPDDWDAPSKDLKPEIYRISDSRSEIICVPAGYANCLRAEEPGSVLMVLSGKRYPECLEDSWRYPADYWFDWEEL